MRTETVTRRVGELLGPVDWDYDFRSHYWDSGGSFNPDLLDEQLARLYVLAETEGEWEATTVGGWPRVGWGRVLTVGMYDGWPYWRPVPSVLIAGMFGREWTSFMRITDIARLA